MQYLRSSQLRSVQPMSLWYSRDSAAVVLFTVLMLHTDLWDTYICAKATTLKTEILSRPDRYRPQLMCACDPLVIQQGSSYNFPDRLLYIRLIQL